MKLKRICALPLAFLADAATLGNLAGDRSFTQQVFDAERQEQRARQDLEELRVLTELITIARRLS